MPVVGNEDQVLVTVGAATALHVPHSLQGSFAQKRAAERDVLTAAAIDVARKAVERGVVNEHVVHSVNVPVKIPDLYRT